VCCTGEMGGRVEGARGVEGGVCRGLLRLGGGAVLGVGARRW